MKTAWTNLRMALSRPWAVWTLFGGAVAVYGLLVLREARGDYSAGFQPSEVWISVLLFGGFFFKLRGLDEAMTKPFLFLLPGYRESLRRASFSRAIRWGVAFSLYRFSDCWGRLLLSWDFQQTYAAGPAGSSADVSLPFAPGIFEIPLSMAGGYLGGMALRLLWTCDPLVHFRRKWLNVVVTGLGGVMFFLLLSARAVGHPYVIWPVLVPLSAFFCIWFWRRLGDMTWVKNGHRMLVLQMIEGSRGFVVQSSFRPRPGRRPGRWYLDRMRKADVDAIGRHMWGWVYREFGPILPYWRWIVALLVACILVASYAGRFTVESLSLGFGAAVAAFNLPVSSSMLLPEGRKVKYRLLLAMAGIVTLFLVMVSGSAVALSHLFASILPQIPWGGQHLRCAGIPMASVWLACLPVPWLFAARPTGYRVPLVRGAIAIIIAGLVLAEIFLRDYGFYRGPTLAPALWVCGWVFFLLMAWITYGRWDLVGQRPAGQDWPGDRA